LYFNYLNDKSFILIGQPGNVMNRLLIATSNEGKKRELEQALQPFFPHSILGLRDYPDSKTIAELGLTFQENAELKAHGYALQTRCWVLADDSGLAVDALGGAPGVYSARYARENASDHERIEVLLDELKTIEERKRTARFICVLSLADESGQIVNSWTGTCEGRIAHQPAGQAGFGYDPIFIPQGYNQTFAELPADIKAQISHRARAFQAMLPELRRFFSSAPA
jgi:XTP/dITP diphosphohydrolase